MATNQEFADYVCDQLSLAGFITAKKMFGEYGVYCDGIIIGLLCDNQFFLKKTDEGRKVLQEIVEVPAYKGAKPTFLIESLEDKEYLETIVRATLIGLVAKRVSTIRG